MHGNSYSVRLRKDVPRRAAQDGRGTHIPAGISSVEGVRAMQEVGGKIEEAWVIAAGMAWQTGWTLVLGFAISALLQSVVSQDEMKRALGRGGPKEIALAALAGAASSSCSYASAAIMRTLFKKGAALITALAFLFASTNLVL